jgi:hypothetical protein
MGFLTGVIVGSMLSDGGSQTPPLPPYETDGNSQLIMCRVADRNSCDNDLLVITTQNGLRFPPNFLDKNTYICTFLHLRRLRCSDYYISKQSITFDSNGDPRNFIFEMKPVKK